MRKEHWLIDKLAKTILALILIHLDFDFSCEQEILIFCSQCGTKTSISWFEVNLSHVRWVIGVLCKILKRKPECLNWYLYLWSNVCIGRVLKSYDFLATFQDYVFLINGYPKYSLSPKIPSLSVDFTRSRKKSPIFDNYLSYQD